MCVNDIAANREGAEECVREIMATGRKAHAVIADVSKRSEVEHMVEKSVDVLGPLNVMIANAGISQTKNVFDVSEQDLERMFQVNLYGVFYCYQIAAKQFVKQETPGKLIGAAR